MTATPRPPRAILFDWDNTLVDTWGTIHAVLEVTFQAMDMPPWSLAEVRQRVRHALGRSFPDLFGERWQEAAEIYFKAYEDRHLENLIETPGAGEMLAELAGAGLYLAVVSNKTGRYLRQEAAHLGWSDYFGRLVGAGDAARDKPSPEPVGMALSGSEIAAGPEVWFVGDNEIDMELAHECGCVPVLLGNGGHADGVFSDHPPALELDDCAALARLIGGR
ncbi:MAG: HAD family hydrolase [Alphaproteobacteria bacterium]|nr:HAD family hydrolase [Alphaproteobacteria bacterium]